MFFVSQTCEKYDFACEFFLQKIQPYLGLNFKFEKLQVTWRKKYIVGTYDAKKLKLKISGRCPLMNERIVTTNYKS